MKIGIYLSYGPQTSFYKEGLGRLLGGIIGGFVENNEEILIACPKWSLDGLNELFDSMLIEKKRIEYIFPKRERLVFKLYRYCPKAIKTKFKKMLYDIDSLKTRIKKIIETNIFIFIVLTTVLALLAIQFSVIKVIVAFLGIIILGILLFFVFIKTIKNVYDCSIRKTANDIVKKINSCCLNVDVWYVPTIFWPQANDINGTVVMNVPDVVTQEFPIAFSTVKNSEKQLEDARKSILYGCNFITYSEYLRDSVLINQYGKDKQNVEVILNVSNNMSVYFRKKDLLYINAYFDEANDILIDYYGDDYVNKNLDKYMFYASQVRPNKNMLNLIKGFEKYLAKTGENYKIVLTANLKESYFGRKIFSYITNNNLIDKIVLCYNVPANILAALYAKAILTISPTLYEGGFPIFTYTESVSVATPLIMSDIPQTKEVLNNFDLKDIMFDPYDSNSISEKIDYAICNLDKIYEKEIEAYNLLKKRTYKNVANDYKKAFEKFMTNN